METGAASFDVERGVSVVVIVTFSLKYLGPVFERKKVAEDLYPTLRLPSILLRLSSELVSYGIDYIYTYPGLRTELVNTNQHLHSTLYLHIRISVTLPSISFEIAMSGLESHHVVTEENGIIFI